MKVLLGIVAALAVIFIGLGLIAPKEYKVERSTTIDAPTEVVFPHVKFFQKRAAWYPWGKRDPNMKSEIVGTDGTVGAVSKWSGNDEVGTGEQTLTEIKENEAVRSHLKFVTPFESESDSYMKLKDENGKTNITWGLEGNNGFIGGIMMMLMGVDMDTEIGGDYEAGLKDLKTIAEKDYADQMAAKAAAEAAALELEAAVEETVEKVN